MLICRRISPPDRFAQRHRISTRGLTPVPENIDTGFWSKPPAIRLKNGLHGGWTSRLTTSVLERSAKAILGEHDYSAYGTPPRAGSSTIRCVTRSEWQMDGNELRYFICGNAFLYHMVRRLVFVQVEAASGRIDINRLVEQFEKGFSDHPGIAPARGLELIKVEYERDTGNSQN